MGYKLAGYDVIGNCEIDPKMMKIYKKNHHPRFPYLMDIRDFVKIPDEEIPEELKNLDVLDGSPPCSVFSVAGDREEAWGKEKKFREGQKEQRLDDLFLYFIAVAKKLQPKVVIAENVKGILLGNARGWVNQIVKAFGDAGYVVQIFLLNAARMGVPQTRERVFFVARRKDFEAQKLKLDFDEPPIPFGAVRSEKGKEAETEYATLLKYRKKTDRTVADISERLRKSTSGYTEYICHDDEVANTLTSSGALFRMCDGCYCTDEDYISIQTFPRDYDFDGENVKYVCGMSVPPVMMAHVAEAVYEHWLKGANEDWRRKTEALKLDEDPE